MRREHWGSQLGFILAVAGSAIGLANIWRFPYVTGSHGGAAFILIYLICLIFIGIPAFIAEITIGRKAQQNPSGAFLLLGRSNAWGWVGKCTVLTGFIVSAFYSAVAGWILGYFVEAVGGSLIHFETHAQANAHYQTLIETPWWGISFHALFLFVCVLILYLGVKSGIERFNKILMPLLFAILIILVLKGFAMPNSIQSLSFLLKPDWSMITPAAFLVALGQSFFTLSIGQGTLVTYGSYLSKKENIITSTLIITLMDTSVSLFSSLAVFTIVFAVGIAPDQGPSLIFNTFPLVFSQIAGGYFLSVMFFALVLVAAITSEISALEPAIAYLCDAWKWKRHQAVIACGFASFLLGVPCALSLSVLKDVHLLGDRNVLETFMFLCSNILIPIGGFAAVVLLGWRYGIKDSFEEINYGTHDHFIKNSFLQTYLKVCFRYVSPLLIVVVFLQAIGIFG